MQPLLYSGDFAKREDDHGNDDDVLKAHKFKRRRKKERSPDIVRLRGAFFGLKLTTDACLPRHYPDQ